MKSGVWINHKPFTPNPNPLTLDVPDSQPHMNPVANPSSTAYKACGEGKRQSPINIKTSPSSSSTDSSLKLQLSMFSDMGTAVLRLEDPGFGVWSSGFGFRGLGCGVRDSGLGARGSGFNILSETRALLSCFLRIFLHPT